MTKKSFDLIFSMGFYCFNTSFLRAKNLQKFSYPFDWLYGASFQDRIDILCNKFNNFFNLEDLEFTKVFENENTDEYKNNRTHFNHCHDFKRGEDLKEAYPRVKDKFDRRIKRLLDTIKKSQKVLLVFMENPNYPPEIQSDSELVDAQSRLAKAFSANNAYIYIYYFQHNENFTENQMEVLEVNDFITKITLFNRELLRPENTGNLALTNKILENLELKKTLAQKATIFLKKFISCFIPIKSLRRKIRGQN